jgi:hypothetical protein
VKLTREEEEELLSEWKPEPLISEIDPDHEALHVPIIDHKVNIFLICFQSVANFYRKLYFFHSALVAQ